MRIYPQFVLWSYVLLPAICILLSPTLILSIAKAQQARAKAVANAVNLKTRAAAALARNQVRNHQRKLAPSAKYANGFAPRPAKIRSTRDLEDPKATTGINNERLKRRTHWDQQEETMGMLQNMWNMNGMNNMYGDSLRNAAVGPNGLNQVEEMVGNAKAHENIQLRPTSTHSGPFFGRNIYDETLGEETPLGEDDKGFSDENDPFENIDEHPLPWSGEERSHHKKSKKYKKHDDSDESAYNYYNYYRNGNKNEDRFILEQISEQFPEIMNERMTEPRHRKKSKKNKDHTYSNYYPGQYYPGQYYPGQYYGRNNENEKLTDTDFPGELMEADLLSRRPHPSNIQMQPLQLTQNDHHIEHFEQQSEHSPAVGLAPNSEYYNARNNHERPLEGIRPKTPEVANVQNEPPIQLEQVPQTTANLQFKVRQYQQLPTKISVNDPKEAETVSEQRGSNPIGVTGAGGNGEHRLEEVGCEHEDEVFDKRPDNDALYKNAYHEDPNAFYQRAVDAVNEKITEATKKLNVHQLLINPGQNAYDQSSIMPKHIVPVSGYSHSQPQVEYSNTDENSNGEPITYQQEDVGTVHHMSASLPHLIVDESSMRDADPHLHKRGPHSFGVTRIHSYKYESQPIPPAYQLPPPPAFHSPPPPPAFHSPPPPPAFHSPPPPPAFHPPPLPPHNFAQANAHAQSISQGPSIGGFASNGFGFPAHSSAHSIAQANSQTFNSGFGHSLAQATAQATAQASAQASAQATAGQLHLYESPLQSRESLAHYEEQARPASPQQQELPTKDLTDETKRFSRSSQIVTDAMDGLNLASDIAHAALNLNPMINLNQDREVKSAKQKELIRLLTDLVDQSMRNEQTMEGNAASNKTKISDANSGPEATDVTLTSDTSSKTLKLKREIYKKENNSGYDDISQSDQTSTETSKYDFSTPYNPNEILHNTDKSDVKKETQKSQDKNEENETTVDGDKLNAQDSEIKGLKDQITHSTQQLQLESNAGGRLGSTSKFDLDKEPDAKNDYITTKFPLTTESINLSPKADSEKQPQYEKHESGLESSKRNLNVGSEPNKRNDQDLYCTTTALPPTPENTISGQDIGSILKTDFSSVTDKQQHYKKDGADLLGAQQNLNLKGESAGVNGKDGNYLITESPLTPISKLGQSESESKENQTFTENIVGSQRHIDTSDESSEESVEDGTNYSVKIITPHPTTPSGDPSTDDGEGEHIPTLEVDKIEDMQFSIPDKTVKPTSVELITENPTTISPLEDETTTDNITLESTDSDSSKTNPSSETTKVNLPPVVKSEPNKLILNDPIDVNPFESIEEEMGILTDAEKDLFIKQEVKLISEIIAEIVKNKTANTEAITDKIPTNSKEHVSAPNLFESFDEKYSSFKRFHPEYNREARSISKADEDFDVIVGAQKEKLESIENEANDDDDLLMISFIGSGILKDLEHRKYEAEQEIIAQSREESYSTKGTKRAISDIGSNLPVAAIISNPNTQIDISKTFDNVGAIVRQTFESPKAPLYHVRNMMGNTKNSIMSAAKIPPNNILVPSNYKITPLSEDKYENQKLGDINQKMLYSRSGMGNLGQNVADLPTEDSFDIMNTFQKIGGIVKESVDNGKKVVVHANDAARDAKNAVHAARHTVPRLILPDQRPLIATRTSFPDSVPIIDHPVLLTPRLLDVHHDKLRVEQEMPKDFVGMGDILDAVGLSKPGQKEIALQQIPLKHTGIRKLNQWSISNPNVGGTNNLEIENDDSVDGLQHLDSLHKAENSVGAKTLKEFFNKMRQEMKEIVKSQQEDRKIKRMDKMREQKARLNSNRKKDTELPEIMLKLQEPTSKTPYDKPHLLTGGRHHTGGNDIGEINDVTLPPEILNIFTDHAPASPETKETEKFNSNRYTSVELTDNSNLKNINVKLKEANENATPSEITETISPETLLNNPNEKVGLFLEPELMKPFMGEPSEDMLHSFMRENGDPLSTEETKRRVTEKLSEQAPENFININNPNITIASSANGTSWNLLLPTDSSLKQVEEPAPAIHQQSRPLDEVVPKEESGHILGTINSFAVDQLENKPSNIKSISTGKVDKAWLANDHQKPKKELPKDFQKYKFVPNVIPFVQRKPKENNLDQQQTFEKNEDLNKDSQEIRTEPPSIDSSERKSMIINDRFQIPFLGALDDDKIHEFFDQYNSHPKYRVNEENLQITPVKSFIFSEEEDYNGYI